jgi:hypothetical protein
MFTQEGPQLPRTGIALVDKDQQGIDSIEK